MSGERGELVLTMTEVGHLLSGAAALITDRDLARLTGEDADVVRAAVLKCRHWVRRGDRGRLRVVNR